MATLTISDGDLLLLVIAAFREAEIEGQFDLAWIEGMPSPLPELLGQVRQRHAEYMSLDFPYDVYPDGWESSLTAPAG